MKARRGSFFPRVSLGNKKVNIYSGEILINEKEVQETVSYCRFLWQKVLEKMGGLNFCGFVRFDLIPQFKEKIREEEDFFHFGDLGFSGIYEINAHSPECSSAYSQMKAFGAKVPSLWKKMASLIKESFGERILFIQGSGPVKREWGTQFIRDLQEAGLLIEVISHPYTSLGNPENLPIWRWGDARLNGSYDDFPLEVQKWILEEQKRGVKVFNTIPDSSERDPGNKIFLSDSFTGRVELPEAQRGKKDDFILKPLRGSSGNGIHFGRLMREAQWQEALDQAIDGELGLYRCLWLPRVKMNGHFVAFDFNPIFWANGSSLIYLHSVVRIDDWESYWNRGTINVAQGAGIASVIEQ